MKKHLSLLSYALLAITIIFASCKPDDNIPSEEEQKLNDLAGSYALTGASVDTESLAGIIFTFTTDADYSITGYEEFVAANLNHDDVFAASGTFSLNDNLDVATLSPGGEVTIVSINTETGMLVLLYSSPFPKSSDVAQDITLTLTKQ
ncbi:hypothetical protein GCM10027429_27540 [Marivirga atlantica]|jgi:hypothetical protein|uniref:Lipocalin-like domain-containing protein n=1 Tax=Marivirga atlantica TaxID=1548457 RepID=A0A937DKL3_9BACT|nr:hypothetical protein [Marivirga atlantica]MBL0766356.1 hypothetical protein [Marivirga atlantica]